MQTTAKSSYTKSRWWRITGRRDQPPANKLKGGRSLTHKNKEVEASAITNRHTIFPLVHLVATKLRPVVAIHRLGDEMAAQVGSLPTTPPGSPNSNQHKTGILQATLN